MFRAWATVRFQAEMAEGIHNYLKDFSFTILVSDIVHFLESFLDDFHFCFKEVFALSRVHELKPLMDVLLGLLWIL